MLLNLVIARIAHRHGEHLVIGLGVIDHIEDSHGTHFDHAAGEAGVGHQDQNIDRIAVVGDGAGDEAVIARGNAWANRARDPDGIRLVRYRTRTCCSRPSRFRRSCGLISARMALDQYLRASCVLDCKKGDLVDLDWFKPSTSSMHSRNINHSEEGTPETQDLE